MTTIIDYVKNNLSTVVVFGLLLAWILYQRIPMYQASSRMEARPAPDFELAAVDGSRMRLSELRGRVVVVNFWATWCMPCRVEIPMLRSIYSDLKPEGLVVLGITQESPAQVAPFVREHEMNYPVLYDADGTVAESYGIQGYPTVVIVDREGSIHSFTTGLNFFMRWQIKRLVTGRWI